MLHKRINANKYVEQFFNDRSHSKHNINLQDNVNAEKRNDQIEKNVSFFDSHGFQSF